MNRKGQVFFKDYLAGSIEETETGYRFTYTKEYLAMEDCQPISKTLPVNNKVYTSNTMFPFFDGLIPEGWLLDVAVDNWKLKTNDRMGLLLACCKDCIGAVSILPFKANNHE
ncbi:HipA N-terminal domain-containing protein [Saccharicrinis fermentans]|uniref:Serine/threonine-protein kinase HipA n=1 Tax=Saccharicrinis fermentans DSM 9555 = JCM 21142 TaxID=869213 RepID=W7Y4P2_9BACT|nr:HipA N-terminal domain-containing protein [Saccharicrinis fermentans]GAF05880.1 serine/threonine-protein kinase HipA [Saccharicrinis fermentans DSM 9555 = JCM 21142]